jgi:hypothetical protein
MLSQENKSSFVTLQELIQRGKYSAAPAPPHTTSKSTDNKDTFIPRLIGSR